MKLIFSIFKSLSHINIFLVIGDLPYDHQQLSNKFSHLIDIGSSALLLHILHLTFWKTFQHPRLIQFLNGLAIHLKMASIAHILVVKRM